MCTIITHPVVPIVISVFFPKNMIPTSLLLIGATCSIVPDLDVIGFRFGINYSDLLGHRGLTHSIFFALLLSGLITLFLSHSTPTHWWAIFLFLFLSTLSHPILDAMTDGGLGVAFFAPIQNSRYFFPWRPIAVSPIGVGGFLTSYGMHVILSELRWVWLPSAAIYILMKIFYHRGD